MKTVYFVRHGETEGNAGNYFQLPETPLSDRGRSQAAMIAERAARLPAEIIIASPMERARETAGFIAQKTNLPLVFSDLLKERMVPREQRGKRRDDKEAQRITAEVTSHFFESGWHFSDEENFDDLNARARAALAFLLDRPEKNLLVVTHGVFMKFMLMHALFGEGLTPTACETILRSVRMENTGLTVLKHGASGTDDYFGESKTGWYLYVWNDHAHLG